MTNSTTTNSTPPQAVADPIREALQRLLAVIKPQYTDPVILVAVVRAIAAARAALAAEPPAPVAVAVAERPWERPGWCDAKGRCWWFAPTEAIPGGFRSAGWSLYAEPPADEDTHCLPHWAIPQPQSEEVQ